MMTTNVIWKVLWLVATDRLLVGLSACSARITDMPCGQKAPSRIQPTRLRLLISRSGCLLKGAPCWPQTLLASGRGAQASHSIPRPVSLSGCKYVQGKRCDPDCERNAGLARYHQWSPHTCCTTRLATAGKKVLECFDSYHNVTARTSMAAIDFNGPIAGYFPDLHTVSKTATWPAGLRLDRRRPACS